FFQARDGIRDYKVTGVQTCALPISPRDPCVVAARFTISGSRLGPSGRGSRAWRCAWALVLVSMAPRTRRAERPEFTRAVGADLEIGRASCRERICMLDETTLV